MLLVSIEGNIGAGKSTLLRAMEAAYGDAVRSVFEPVERWCAPLSGDGVDGVDGGGGMLGAYYEGKRCGSGRDAFAFQMFAMLTRLQQLKEVLTQQQQEADEGVGSGGGSGCGGGGGCGGGVALLFERGPWSDHIVFGRMMRESGELTDAEWHAYTSWVEAMSASTSVKPDGLVRLRCPVERCLERVGVRGRAGEAGRIEAAYLARVEASIDRYVGGDAMESGVPVLELDASEEGDGAVRSNAARLMAWLRQLKQQSVAV